MIFFACATAGLAVVMLVDTERVWSSGDYLRIIQALATLWFAVRYFRSWRILRRDNAAGEALPAEP